MSARSVGLPAGLLEQPGWTYTVDKTGLFTLRTVFECHVDEMIDLQPAIGSVHYRFRFATLEEVTGSGSEGERGTMTCVYKGTKPDAAGNNNAPPVYQLIANTREEPIETNPEYKDLTPDELKKIKTFLEGDSTSLDQSGLTGKARELAEKKLRGQESYMRRSVVWRKTTTNTAGFASIGDVGKINAPEGNAPSNGSGNWLLLSREQKQQGTAWECVEEWMASGDEKWDEDIYKA